METSLQSATASYHHMLLLFSAKQWWADLLPGRHPTIAQCSASLQTFCNKSERRIRRDQDTWLCLCGEFHKKTLGFLGPSRALRKTNPRQIFRIWLLTRREEGQGLAEFFPQETELSQWPTVSRVTAFCMQDMFSLCLAANFWFIS